MPSGHILSLWPERDPLTSSGATSLTAYTSFPCETYESIPSILLIIIIIVIIIATIIKSPSWLASFSHRVHQPQLAWARPCFTSPWLNGWGTMFGNSTQITWSWEELCKEVKASGGLQSTVGAPGLSDSANRKEQVACAINWKMAWWMVTLYQTKPYNIAKI